MRDLFSPRLPGSFPIYTIHLSDQSGNCNGPSGYSSQVHMPDPPCVSCTDGPLIAPLCNFPTRSVLDLTRNPSYKFQSRHFGAPETRYTELQSLEIEELFLRSMVPTAGRHVEHPESCTDNDITCRWLIPEQKRRATRRIGLV